MAISRETRNLTINGAPALIHGYRPEVPCTVYYYKGATYELDQSADTAAWAAEGAATRRLAPGQYHLEAIIDDKVEDGETKYLARWLGTDESTYEPAAHFRAEDIAEYEAVKARLDQIEMDVDFGDVGLEDSAGAIEADPMLSAASDSEPAEASSQIDGVPEDVEMGDAPPVGVVSQDAPEMPASTADQRVASAAGTDADDQDDEEAECNDPLGSGLVGGHGDAYRCSSTSHTNQSRYSCDACRGEVVATLSQEQNEAIDHGADRPLCHECGEQHLEDPSASFPCECSTEALCGDCLWERADDLALKRRTLTASYDETTCATCDEELLGGEKVTKCALCLGLKVRL